MKLRTITINCGPGPIAYLLTEDTLDVWTGDQVDQAPPEARRSEVLKGCVGWAISDRPDVDADVLRRLNELEAELVKLKRATR